jgi:uncharacterized membrane protein YphA (DoxX/SURF4 family)
MNIVLWVIQALLAAAFLMAGIMKTLRPKEQLAPKMPWTEDFSPLSIKCIGLAEFLAALGLVLPPLTGILPVLTAWAALGLTLVMLGAVGTHIRRKEPSAIAFTAVLAASVAYGRFVLVPFGM